MIAPGGGFVRTHRSAAHAHLYAERSHPDAQPSGQLIGAFVHTT
jgi:hypothetical protein